MGGKHHISEGAAKGDHSKGDQAQDDRSKGGRREQRGRVTVHLRREEAKALHHALTVALGGGRRRKRGGEAGEAKSGKR